MRLFTRRHAAAAAILFLAALVPVLSQTTPPTITFRIIVVETREAAERILARLRAGENFVALAAEVSDDPSASNGGLVGWSLRGLGDAPLDGLPTAASESASPDCAESHPNGVSAIDHVVAVSPDDRVWLERARPARTG